jgi:fatty acid desaturase
MAALVTDAAQARSVSDYGQLLALVQRAGLLHRSVTAYVRRFLALGGAALAGLGAFVWLGDSWWQLVVAAYAGGLLAQLGFLGHDAGHQQIFSSRRSNDRLGLVLSNLGVGLSYNWWVDKHNRHHRHPNEVGHDPDVERNVLAWTQSQARAQRGVLRIVARHQDVFFFPLLLLEGWNLHVAAARTLLQRPRRHATELMLLSVHVLVTVTVLLTFLSPWRALAFVAVQQSVFGLYLGSTFAPNHKGMQIVDGTARPDFLRRQVLTSRNIKGSSVLTAAFGSLNYQIEHHLFPSMPSRNLSRCRPLVMEFCAAQGVPYAETTMLESYREALRYLRGVHQS